MRRWLKKRIIGWVSQLESRTIYGSHTDERYLYLLILFTGLGCVYPFLVAVLAYMQGEIVNACLDILGVLLVISNFLAFLKHRHLNIANLIYSAIIFIFFLIALFGRMVDGTSLPWISFFNIIIFILSPVRVGVTISILFGAVIGAYLLFLDYFPPHLAYTRLEIIHLFLTYSCTLFGGMSFALSFKSYVDEVARKSRRLETALKKAKKASLAKSEFLANMSHEIRTPIHTLIGMCEVLSDGNQCAVQKQQISVMHDAAQSLSGIINDILDMAQIESGRTEFVTQTIVLKNFLESSLIPYKRKIDDKKLNYHFVFKSDVENTLVHTDGEKLKVIVSNLLANAVKFTQAGSITTSFYFDTKDKILKIDVVDTGCGIKKEHLDKIFFAFSQPQQADGALKGTGLGLTLVKTYVDMFGGTIRVYSEFGKGTTFNVRLPMAPMVLEERKTQEVSETVPITSDFSSLKVLIVEDHKVNRDMLFLFLKKMGIESKSAEDGLIAVDMCSKESFDLIFMDLRMPHMDGITATVHIREKLNNQYTFICAVTANSFEEDKQKCMAAGMNEFLEKPVNIKKLKIVVGEVLKNRTEIKK